MPILYKVITAVLALTGCISLLLTGELYPLMTVSGLAILPGYYRFFKGMQPASKQEVGILSLLTLIVFLTDSIMISGDLLLAVAHLTIAFQALKSFDLREPWDHLQVYFMSLLQLVIASDLTQSLMFGVVYVVFMALLVTAMVLSHFLKEGALGKISLRKPLLLISFLTLVMTVLIFLLLPRTSQKFFGKSHAKGIKTTAFSEKVDFGSFGNLKQDRTVVMRVEMDRAVPFLYWRGLALDYFDGRTWRIAHEEKYRVARTGDSFQLEPCGGAGAVEQRVYLEPIDSDIIFGLPMVCTVNTDWFSLLSDDGKGIYLRGKSARRVKYSIYSMVGDSYPGTSSGRNLQLPEGTVRIKALAEKITAGPGTDDRKAGRIEAYLKKNYVYSLKTSEPPAGVGPIEDFIFNTRKGYCEHYATSMVLMLRTLNIPSRIVTGFYGGEKSEYAGYFIIRQSDAHSWVEALISGKWKRFDPTPATPAMQPSVLDLLSDSIQLNWSRYVVGFSAADQRDLLKGLLLPFRLKKMPGLARGDMKILVCGVAAAALVCLVIFLVYYRLRKRKYEFITDRYLLFRRILKKKGVRLRQSMTPGDIKRATLHLGIAEDLEAFLKIYEEHRFGQRELRPEDRKRYKLLLEAMKKKLYLNVR